MTAVIKIDKPLASQRGMNMTKDFEGFRETVYDDTKGKKTIGYGFRTDQPHIKKLLPEDVLSGKRKLTRTEADSIFPKAYGVAISDAKQYLGEDSFNKLDDDEKDVLVDMSYNLGLPKLQEFKRMKEGFINKDRKKISEEMKDSEWYGQVGRRGRHHVESMVGKRDFMDLSKLNPFAVTEASADEIPQVIKVSKPLGQTKNDVIKISKPLGTVDPKEEFIGTKIMQHPLQAVLNPAIQTLTGKSLQDRALEASAPITIRPNDSGDYWAKFLKNAAYGMAGSIGDIATTPASYIPIPVGKILGKIPIRGTTLSEIATKVPVSQILNKDVATIVKYQNALKNLPKTTAMSADKLNVAAQIDPVNKVIKALEEAEPLRGLQEQLYTIERSKRAGKLTDAAKGKPGEEGYIAQLASLKGPLPKVVYKGIRNQVSQDDIDSLFSMVEDNAVLSPYEKVHAKNGLAQLFGESGGGVPQESQIALLSQVFPKKFVGTLLDKKDFLQRFSSVVGEAINLPRAIMSGTDLSAPLRQGIFFVGKTCDNKAI